MGLFQWMRKVNLMEKEQRSDNGKWIHNFQNNKVGSYFRHIQKEPRLRWNQNRRGVTKDLLLCKTLSQLVAKWTMNYRLLVSKAKTKYAIFSKLYSRFPLHERTNNRSSRYTIPMYIPKWKLKFAFPCKV